MALAPPWSDLTGELVVCIANAHGVSLRDYTCLHGVCTAWRSALEPPYPCLLSLAADNKGRYIASVFSLPVRRPFHLHTVSSRIDGSRDHDRRTPFSQVPSGVVGSSKPSFTIEGCSPTEARIRVIISSTPSFPIYGSSPTEARARVVGSSNGRFAVAVDHGRPNFNYRWTRRIFLLDPHAGKEVELTVPITLRNCESGGRCRYVHKVVFPTGPDDGTVVALYDYKYVAYIDVAACRGKWTTIDVVTRNKEHLADLAFGDDGKLYCLDSSGGVHVVCIPRGGRNETDVVEHLSAVFAPPYDIWSALTTTKHIFFCHGSLYQVWQNNNSIEIPSGGFRMSADEILVLRYDPGRWPCWDAVKDLGGCSVFVGKMNSPVVRDAGVPGVRADCVYWINWLSSDGV